MTSIPRPQVLRAGRGLPALAALLLGLLLALAAAAQEADEGLVNLDFDDAELADVIDTIARLTNTNFIYDDRVRGRVTLISPTPMPVDQAFAVFESVLQVKGFTTVRTPGGALKIVPLRDAKESNIETRESARPPLDRDRFVTRLIPLRYIEAESIVNTLKPLVSKDAAMAAYEPTNTVILTESASNIRRIMSILGAIDVETYREELTVIQIKHADAATLADQISEIYGAEVETAAASRTRRRSRRGSQQAASGGESTPAHGRVRILTDERTNSLIVLAARTNLEEVRALVRRLDVPVPGGGRIHVYYLNHANADELAQTLSALISGQPRQAAGGAGAAGAAGGGAAQALRTAVSGLAEGVTITADPATNSLVIQASKEGYATIEEVIQKLDVQRPQVLVEALIMEVDVTDSQSLGLNWLVEFMAGNTEGTIVSATELATRGALAGATGGGSEVINNLPFIANIVSTPGDSTIQAIISASASDTGTNIISAPHILTSDNEQAEIRIGNNIPIISSRVQSAQGLESGLNTSVNVERQDVGVTLRVTPQITEGDTLRMEIFQEITSINEGLQEDVGSAEDVGVPLSNRRVENTVVVDDGETVVIGGLISEDYQDVVAKIPWLGDIPVLGWAFKSTDKTLRKVNLLVFLTPHIIREADDLEYETIRKREEFISSAEKALRLSELERARIEERRAQAELRGEEYEDPVTKNPVRTVLLQQETRYPTSMLDEIEQRRLAEREAREAARLAARRGPEFYVQAALLDDEGEAVELLTELVDSGWDGVLIAGAAGGRTLFEVRLGPFEELEEANAVAETISLTHRLQPALLVLTPEEEAEQP